MAIFKCKICGGTLEIDGTQSVATCEYCGTKQTLPKLDDERKANLYDRANHFRRNNDFDKAMSIYEQILNEDNTDAESYWSILLCRYGIEYVEDPATHKRVPTINRAQYTSIFDDEDYKSALQYADNYQREIYEAEANAINEIQKNILAISQKEEPFDVFICYKETDSNGRRTQDSVLATELYHELTREGFKVFFSRITLEDRLGQEYEPYIFAALNSAKVMVVLGTKPEHFNAVWVKNEWSRYLALIKNGAKKTLIPAYRDMDPYDLPEEFSHLQAQDMSKLGFMQDLTRGIKKIVEADATQATIKETVVTSAAAPNIAPLLKRAFLFLEDGEFDRADDFCEQVLNQDPENAEAYLGKLMVDLHVKKREELANCAEPFDDNKYFQKAVRFADAALATDLKGYVAYIMDRNAKDEEARKELLYLKAMNECNSNNIDTLESALKELSSITGYKDSDEQARLCKEKIEQIQVKEEKDRIKSKKRENVLINILSAVAIITIIVVAAFIIFTKIITPNLQYRDAIALMNQGKYEEAISEFEVLGGYKDEFAYEKIMNCYYKIGLDLMDNGEYAEAAKAFSSSGHYKDSIKKRTECIRSFHSQTISAGYFYTVGLKSDGTVVAVGYNDGGQCDVSSWEDIIAISAGAVHTVGLKSDGTVVAVGYNDNGQCNVSGWKDIIAISAGRNYTVGLKSDGTVVAVGYNGYDQCNVSGWKDIIAISAGAGHTVGLKSDGTVVAVGLISDGGCNVSGWRNIMIPAKYKDKRTAF